MWSLGQQSVNNCFLCLPVPVRLEQTFQVLANSISIWSLRYIVGSLIIFLPLSWCMTFYSLLTMYFIKFWIVLLLIYSCVDVLITINLHLMVLELSSYFRHALFHADRRVWGIFLPLWFFPPSWLFLVCYASNCKYFAKREVADWFAFVGLLDNHLNSLANTLF